MRIRIGRERGEREREAIMKRSAVSTIGVFSFMEHFQFNIKLVPACYDTEQIDGEAFKYTDRISRVEKLPRHVIC
jgi:hypothetical protein